jgi:hypothetical protein
VLDVPDVIESWKGTVGDTREGELGFSRAPFLWCLFFFGADDRRFRDDFKFKEGAKVK